MAPPLLRAFALIVFLPLLSFSLGRSVEKRPSNSVQSHSNFLKARYYNGGRSPSVTCTRNASVCQDPVKNPWGGPTCCWNKLCKDTNSDVYNCGDCGVTCLLLQTCCSGSCVDLNLDTENCGECGNRCSDGEACSLGMCGYAEPSPSEDCEETCLPLQTCCSGSCVDLNLDTDNCGECGNRCSDGEACTLGTCANAEPSPSEDCEETCLLLQTCCSGSCVDLNLDTDNCGECGNQCSDGEACSLGTCANAEPSAGGDCEETCLLLQTCCSGSCVDLNLDTDNCGECGNQCSDGEACLLGTCGSGPLP